MISILDLRMEMLTRNGERERQTSKGHNREKILLCALYILYPLLFFSFLLLEQK